MPGRQAAEEVFLTMANRTKTLQNFYDDVQRLLGIDSLSTDDKEFLLQGWNRNGRYAYEEGQWPQTMTIDSRTVTSNRIQLDGAAPYIGLVINVWDNDPFGTSSYRELPWMLYGNYIQVLGNSAPASAYVAFQQRWTDSTGTLTDTVPYEIFPYVVRASAGDWLIGQEQYGDGRALIADAEVLLARELEKLSQTQGQPFLRGVFKTHGTEQIR